MKIECKLAASKCSLQLRIKFFFNNSIDILSYGIGILLGAIDFYDNKVYGYSSKMH